MFYASNADNQKQLKPMDLKTEVWVQYVNGQNGIKLKSENTFVLM